MDAPTPRRPTSPEEKRPCWECLRRRLVCDFGRPTCKKCLKTGIVCPGYGNAKPLKWLAPGSVTFRRRKDVPTRSYPTSGSASSGGSSGSSSSEGSEAGSPQKATGEAKLTVPRVDMKCESTDIVQAYTYYNEQIFPAYAAASMCRSPYVTTLSLDSIAHSPIYLCHICASIALRYRIYRLSSTPERNSLVDMKLKYHQQRSRAIQVLNENIASAEKKNPYLLIIGVNMFVFAELQHSLAPAWKFHMDAVLGIITRQGGLMGVCKKVPGMKMPLISFVMAYITGCTTSPPSTLKLKPSQEEDMEAFVRKEWEHIPYPNFLCPVDLLLPLMQVNSRRSNKARSPAAALDGPAPEEILEKMTDFSPESWAATKTRDQGGDWLLLGRIYQSAAILFCLSSLAGQFTWVSDQDLDNMQAVHKARLASYLRRANESLPVIRACLWPVIVAGVVMGPDDLGVRELVRCALEKLADELAVASLLEAKAIFETFWWGEKRGWDDCFHRPYALVQ